MTSAVCLSGQEGSALELAVYIYFFLFISLYLLAMRTVPAWRLALSPLYEWMGVALVTGNEAVVIALADRRWRALWVKAGLQ